MINDHANLDRRAFLAAATGAAAGVLAGGNSAAQDTDPAPAPRGHRPRHAMVRKALKFGMIGEGETIADKLKIARDAGFEGVEFDSPNDLDTDEILAARDSSGVTITGVVDSVHWSKPLSHPDPAVRMEGRHALERAMLDCRAYGGTTVLLVPGVVNATVSYAEAWDRSLREIRAAAPMAQDIGVQIAIENVWNNFLLSPLEARAFIDEAAKPLGKDTNTVCADGIARPVIAWYFDVGNIWAYGWPRHWLDVFGSGPSSHLARLDIKGYSRAKADKEGRWAGFGVEIGEDDVPWDTVRDWIAERGWSGWATAEVRGGDRARLREISGRMDTVLGLGG